MEIKKSILVAGITIFLAISLIVVGSFLTGGANQNPFFTSKIRAASVTYKRDFTLLANAQVVSPTVTVSPSAAPSQLPSATPTAVAQSPTPSITPTLSPVATDTIAPTDTDTPTPMKALPRTGWTQNVSIMFIAASVLMFVSFIF